MVQMFGIVLLYARGCYLAVMALSLYSSRGQCCLSLLVSVAAIRRYNVTLEIAVS